MLRWYLGEILGRKIKQTNDPALTVTPKNTGTILTELQLEIRK